MKRVLFAGMAITAMVVASAGAARAIPDEAIVHVLNRVGYGPRAGDIEKIGARGVLPYIDEQLHPERIADAAVAFKLAGLPTIAMGPDEILDRYERPLIEARRQRKMTASSEQGDAAAAKRRGATPRPDTTLVAELAAQKVLRAVYSERQLQEVLTDFWFNHFNVDARKGRTRFLLTEYERDVIRPHVLGRFRDLLGATARSPAMLFYLDNWLSVDPAAARPRRKGSESDGATAVPPRGLNENYARELMELHTVGVDGGYTQRDVTEVARAFTGWTIVPPREGGGFKFAARMHDNRSKVVLGHVIPPGGGEADGERVLDILAAHPSTARLIATQLARRFVADVPPSALVDRAAARFLATHGDLREVTRLILTSPEFLSPQVYSGKIKTPLEFVVSALRAGDAQVTDAAPWVRQLQQLGMPLYMCQPPTGYKDTADAWVSTAAIVGRLNVAVSLAGADTELAQRLGSPQFQKR
jgi:uncharacterized protein (DUF1800 family)